MYAVRVLGYVVGMEVSREAICIGLFKFRIDLLHSFGIVFIRLVQGEWCINVKFLFDVGQRKKLPVYI